MTRRRDLLLAGVAPAGRLLAYATCVGLACAFLFVGHRLEGIDLKVPILSSGDSLLIVPMVQAQHEGGTHWVNARMGAPGVQELYDFPVIDSLHFAAVALIDRAVGHPVVAMNVYYLLTYPLAAFCGMLAGRLLGLSLSAAGCLGLLYAFLPYHQMRGFSHYFLSAYYLVPLALVVVVNLSLGRVRLRRAFWPVAAMLATSCAGAYYAFFVCALLAAAGLYGAALRRSYKPLAWGTLLVGVVVAGGVANHAPTYLAQRDSGRNSAPTERQPEDSEHYGLKLTYLVLPTVNHRVPALARWRSAYDSLDRVKDEADTASLGVVGVAGLLVGAAALFRPRLGRRRVARAVAALLAAAFLEATVGGVGALFSELVTAAIRAQARMTIFLAFLALWLALDALNRRAPRRWYARWPLFAGVAALGLLDTTPSDWGRHSRVEARAAEARRYAEDREFYGGVERALGGGVVFQLPYNEYPEGTLQRGSAMGCYDHARGYLHTKATRWSFGAMKHREVDTWQREVATAEAPEMLRRMALRGFDGLCIDWRPYAPEAAAALAKAVLAELREPGPTLTHARGEQTFYDLRPHRDRLKSELGGRFDEMARAEAEAVRVLWFHGFVSFEPLGREDSHRLCARRGEAWVVNPSARTRRVTLTMLARTDSAVPTTLEVAGPVWSESLAIDASSGVHSVTLEVPPGRHVVRFECAPPAGWRPRDARRLVFFLAQFRLTDDR